MANVLIDENTMKEIGNAIRGVDCTNGNSSVTPFFAI